MNPATPARLRCVFHAWERRLESEGGIETVVRRCRRCGHQEVCWRDRAHIRGHHPPARRS